MTDKETKYRVQSLERGLAILRGLRAADAPVRNQDLVQRTGLPKATVSRLLSTLGALGYVRRTDQGSYVLADASARSGRAMLGALGLERHRTLFADAPGPVHLEALVGEMWVPVYRWSLQSTGPVPNGSAMALAPERHLRQSGDGECWDPVSRTWWAWTHLRIEGVGAFSLTMQSVRSSPPSTREASDAHAILQQAAKALAGAKEQ